MDELSSQAVATMLVSLRIAPAFAFAPPFTLLRIPAAVRLLLSISLAAWLVAAGPRGWQAGIAESGLLATAAGELLLGLAIALPLQIAFGALLTAGRAIDIQAGFGLAMLIDPATRSQTPLTGTLFAYAAGAIFFASGGAADLLAIVSASFQQMPPGTIGAPDSAAPLIAYLSAAFVLAFGAGGLAMLVLFLIDLAIAFMSRTLPQMNVLMLGFQVKTLAMLAVLPVALALSAALFLRLVRFALQTGIDLA